MFPAGVSEMAFRGVLRYPDAAALDAALDAVQALIDGEDDDFPTLLDDGQLARRGLELRVHVETACDPELYFAYEAIIETLASRASAGSVEGTSEGTARAQTYAAGAGAATVGEAGAA